MIRTWAINILQRGSQRSVRAKKNVVLGLLYRALGVVIGFAYFPISLAYLGQAEFGIFLTLISIVDWFADFDIGIGNGLRNRLGEAIADDDESLARGYVSTAYLFIGAIFSGIALVGIASAFFLPWAGWLQAEPTMAHEISILVILIFAAFAINFISSLVYQVFYALQQTAIVEWYSLLTKASFLGMIVYLFFFTDGSLVLYGAAKTFTFAMVPLAVGLYYFRNKLRRYRPSLRLARRAYFHSLFSLGFQFFIIKIAMIVIHQTNNILIARFVAPEEVTEYEAAFKYFSIFLMLFVILTNQYWSAGIEAYRQNDMAWMKNMLKSIIRIWGATLILIIAMIGISPFFFALWLQDQMLIPLMMTISVALTIALTNWVNLFNLVLNATGKIRLQMYSWIVASILNIPVSLFLAITLDLGSVGIVLGTAICLLPLVILSPWQVYKILRREDEGIWGR